MLQLWASVILAAIPLACRTEPDNTPNPMPSTLPAPSAHVAEAERLAECTAAAFLVRDTFRHAVDHPYAKSWARLGSNFEGELATDMARIEQRLNEAALSNRAADSLIRGAGEPYNRGHAPADVSADAARLRADARQRLAELDRDVARIADRVTKLPHAACKRIRDAESDKGQP